MSKKIAGLTLDEVMEKLNWVVKYTGYRFTGNYKECERNIQIMGEDNVRDFDICAKQPEELNEFMRETEELTNKHGWMTFSVMFDKFGS